MKYTRIFLFAMLCCSLSFCTSIKNGKHSISQGVFGKITWMEGNFMPSPDRQPAKESTPAVRTIYIYPLTQLNETEGGGPPLFMKINKVVIAKVKTNKEGYFQCKLAPGKYSVFTVEEDKFFANLFDGEGNIAPFEVKAGEVTRYDVSINYKAAF